MKKILIASISLLFPLTAYGAVTVPWQASSTDQGFISPAPVNGSIDAIKVPFIVSTSTTETSTFANTVTVSHQNGTQLSLQDNKGLLLNDVARLDFGHDYEPVMGRIESKVTDDGLGSETSLLSLWNMEAGSLKLDLTLGSASSTFTGKVNTTLLNVTSSATSSFADGINLASGCYAIAGTCITGGGSGTPGGNNTNVQYNNHGSFAGSNSLSFFNDRDSLYVGTSTNGSSIEIRSDDTTDGWERITGVGTADNFVIGSTDDTDPSDLTFQSHDTSGHPADFTFDGANVGIGVVDPSRKLEISGADDNGFGAIGMRISNTDAGKSWELNNVDSDGSFRITNRSAPADDLAILQNNNVGIGTNNPIAKLDIEHPDESFGYDTAALSGFGGDPIGGVNSSNGSTALYSNTVNGADVYLSSYSDDNGSLYGIASVDPTAFNMLTGKTGIGMTVTADTMTPVSPLQIGDYEGGNTPSGDTPELLTLNSSYGHQMQITDGSAVDGSQGSGYWVFDSGSDGGFGSVAFEANNNQVATFLSKDSSQVVFQIGSLSSGNNEYMGMDSSGDFVFQTSGASAPAIVGDFSGHYRTLLAGDGSGNKSIDTGARKLYAPDGTTVMMDYSSTTLIKLTSSVDIGTTTATGVFNVSGPSAGSSTKGVCHKEKAVGANAYIYYWFDSSAVEHVQTGSCSGTGTTTITIE